MLFLVFVVFSVGLQSCSVALDNVKGLLNMDRIIDHGCNNISLTGAISARNGKTELCDLDKIGNTDELVTISFTDCDFSQSDSLFIQGSTFRNTEIIIKNTTIGNGFSTLLKVSKVLLIDCVINITLISQREIELTATNISFINCVFVGKVIPKVNINRNKIFEARHYGGSNEVNEYNFEFIDCEFNLDNDWNKKVIDGVAEDDPQKQFLIVDSLEKIRVNISFIRCFPGSNEANSNLKLIKVNAEDTEKDNINVIGIENSLSVEWSWVVGRSELYYESDWTVVINDTGYYPVQSTSSESESFSIQPDDGNGIAGGEKEAGVSSSWRIVAIVFIALFVVSIIVLVVILIIKKKKYDRSENE